jgi:simple sugar transport system substrate-binding protein
MIPSYLTPILRVTAATACMALTMSGCDRNGQEEHSERSRENIRIVAVTHGQSADPFWSVVSNGINDAAKDMGVRVEYQAPTTFDMVRMSQLIDAAVASKPSALIVSIPDASALGGSLRRAVSAQLPVVSINSGADAWQQLGMLAHIGQTEYEAGRAGGEKLASAGARNVLCINHEVGNAALDERCRGMQEALQAAGGTSSVLAVALADPTDAQQRIANALRSNTKVDGMLTLGPAGAAPALAALRAVRDRKVQFGTFDLGSDVLQALQNREMLFAIDQQPYLQGYLAVTLLVKYLETGAMAGGQQVIRTGPGFVTADNAAQVTRMIERGVR